MQASGARSKREAVELALRTLVNLQQQAEIRKRATGLRGRRAPQAVGGRAAQRWGEAAADPAAARAAAGADPFPAAPAAPRACHPWPPGSLRRHGRHRSAWRIDQPGELGLGLVTIDGAHGGPQAARKFCPDGAPGPEACRSLRHNLHGSGLEPCRGEQPPPALRQHLLPVAAPGAHEEGQGRQWRQPGRHHPKGSRPEPSHRGRPPAVVSVNPPGRFGAPNPGGEARIDRFGSPLPVPGSPRRK
jgi:hypothetical protein